MESQTPLGLWKQQGPMCFMCFLRASWRRRLQPLRVGASCQSAKRQRPATAVNADVRPSLGENRRAKEKVQTRGRRGRSRFGFASRVIVPITRGSGRGLANSLAKKIKASHNICVKPEPHLQGSGGGLDRIRKVWPLYFPLISSYFLPFV